MAKAGVGQSKSIDSRKAADEAARGAFEQSGGPAKLAIIYSTAKHDPAALRDAVRAVVGPSATIIGGTSMGTITPAAVSYGGHEVAVAILSGEDIKVDAFLEPGLDVNEKDVGERLAKRVAAVTYEGDPTCILLHDSIRSAPLKGVPQLNMGSRFLQGFAPGVAHLKTIVGHGMLGDENLSASFQILNDRIERNSALAVVLSGNIKPHVEVAHGCRPSGGYHTVTKAEGNVIFEIDGKPALEYVTTLLGLDAGSVEGYPIFVTLGIHKGAKFAAFKEEDYVSRNLMAVDPSRSALILWETDVVPGTEFQLMRRHIDFAALKDRWNGFYTEVANTGKPFFSLFFNCAGRAAVFANTETEEADVARTTIGTKVPLLGMYSASETSRFHGELTSVSWTGVMTVFTST